MTVKKIEKLLKQALLQEGKMECQLYEHELIEVLDDLRLSMKRDKDDYIFTVTENRGHVGMLLIEKSGEVHIDEQARERLKVLWPAAYESNIKKMIPDFAQQLYGGDLPINGVKVYRR
ncbi:MAG: hypothetical protein KME35_22085 [Aphanocapsa sp. GSE-SYN-MK-11-07L]|jgi:hypothetical protein|nr:hypothetical protein [Aphanocapsa sp. GSE-SYN-MK-11-07L]